MPLLYCAWPMLNCTDKKGRPHIVFTRLQNIHILRKYQSFRWTLIVVTVYLGSTLELLVCRSGVYINGRLINTALGEVRKSLDLDQPQWHEPWAIIMVLIKALSYQTSRQLSQNSTGHGGKVNCLGRVMALLRTFMPLSTSRCREGGVKYE